MKRRDLLVGAATVATLAATTSAQAQLTASRPAAQAAGADPHPFTGRSERLPDNYAPPQPTLPPIPPPSKEQMQAAMARIFAPPKDPPRGKYGLWVWYRIGDPDTDEFLSSVMKMTEPMKDSIDIQYFAAIIRGNLPKSTNFDSVVSKQIHAQPDMNGRNAMQYADGQVPGLVWIDKDTGARSVLSLIQLGMVLSGH